jgi:hypothetical protein
MKDTTLHELNVLLPDRTLTLAGEEITVREFRFAESLELAPLAAPIIADLASMATADEAPAGSALFAVLGVHQEAFLELVARSIGRPRAWIEGLSRKEGRALALTFWEVNADFFLDDVRLEALTRRLLGAESDGESSPSNSSPRVFPRTRSAATPGDNSPSSTGTS